MKHSTFIAGILAAAVCVTGGVALAKQGAERGKVAFETLDTDGNGQISKAEMEARATARFTEADTDGDGFLSEAELAAQASARAAKHATRMIERMDTDKDGKLSTEEMGARWDPAKRFDRADADGNGSISEDEFKEAGRHFRGHRRGDKPSE